MQMRSSDENNVRLSVCLSNAWIVMKREKNQSRFLYTTRKIIYPSFTRKTMIGGADVNFGSNRPRWSEIADFSSIFARNVLAVTPSEERSINTNNKSTTRFPMSRCPMLRKGGGCSKPQNDRFPSKIALRLKKVFSLQSFFVWKLSATKLWGIHWPNCSRKNDWWGNPLYLKFWVKLTALERNRRLSIYFLPYIALQPLLKKKTDKPLLKQWAYRISGKMVKCHDTTYDTLSCIHQEEKSFW